MKYDKAEGQHSDEWGNVPMLSILISIALGYLLYVVCHPFRDNSFQKDVV